MPDVESAVRELPQRREALRDEVGVRRELVVGQDLPVGQPMHRELRIEPRDLLAQALGVLRRGGEDEQGTLEGASRASQSASDDPLAWSVVPTSARGSPRRPRPGSCRSLRATARGRSCARRCRRVDRDRDGHVLHLELADRFHAEVFEGEDLRAANRLGDEVGRAAHRDAVHRAVLLDRFDRHRAALALAHHADESRSARAPARRTCPCASSSWGPRGRPPRRAPDRRGRCSR